MNYSYDAGLTISIWASAVVGVAAFGTRALILVLQGQKQEAYDAVGVLLSLLAASVMGLSLFCLTYTVVNPVVQLDQLSASWFRDELSTGVLTLRVASLLVGGKAFLCATQFLVVEDVMLFGTRYFERSSKHFEELSRLSTFIDDFPKTSSTCPNMVCT
jgi:hypothetical protein